MGAPRPGRERGLDGRPSKHRSGGTSAQGQTENAMIDMKTGLFILAAGLVGLHTTASYAQSNQNQSGNGTAIGGEAGDGGEGGEGGISAGIGTGGEGEGEGGDAGNATGGAGGSGGAGGNDLGLGGAGGTGG